MNKHLVKLSIVFFFEFIKNHSVVCIDVVGLWFVRAWLDYLGCTVSLYIRPSHNSASEHTQKKSLP